MSRAAIAFAFVLAAAAAGPVLAWGELGHRLVGALAQRQLTPRASARVAELLRDEPEPTLSGVAYWADALRQTDPERFKATSRWHYVNMPEGTCHYVAARDCPDGACVVGAIEAQRRLLQDASQPFAVRRDALKFIVHFVGDVHQPLHASNRPDKGANEFQVRLPTEIPPEAYARERYVDGVMSTNLHAVWDYYLLASAKLPWDAYADRLSTRRPWILFHREPADWASESCRYVDRHHLYPATHELDEAYLAQRRSLAEERVVLGGRRLARLLNEVFAAAPGG